MHMHIIDTHRLTLRPWNGNNLFDFHEIISDERVAQCSGTRVITDIEISKEYINNYINYNFSYAIVLKTSNKVIGSIDNKAVNELFYKLTKDEFRNHY